MQRRVAIAASLGVLLICAATVALWWPFGIGPTAISAGAPFTVQALDLDGPFSAQFAGEMVAAKSTRALGSGIQLALRTLPSADFVATVASSGAIGVTSGQKFLLARWRGIPVTAFAASFLDTSTAIFSLERSGLRAPKDLIGKRLSYQPGSEDAVVFDAMLAQLGLPRSQVRNIAVPDGRAALRAGEIDALIAPIGHRPLAPNDGALRLSVMRPQDYGIHIPGLVYFAGSDLLRDRPSVVRRTLQAVILGWQEVYADPDRAARTVVAYDPDRLSTTEVRFALDQQRDLVRPVGTRIAEFDQSRWNTLRDILQFAKLGTETVGLSSAVTYDFLRDVYRRSPELDSLGKSSARPD